MSRARQEVVEDESRKLNNQLTGFVETELARGNTGDGERGGEGEQMSMRGP